MARRWYGSLDNRLEENRMFTDEIKVGTGMTEYLYSDRHAYEVTAVKDQKHVTVRRYDVKNVGGAYSNDWQLISNPSNAERDLEKRGDYWYWTQTVTADMIAGREDDIETQIGLCHGGFDIETIKAKGKQTKRYRANVSFGKADYYYDYEF